MLYLRAGTYELNAPRSEQIVPRVQHGQVNATSAPEPQHDCAANTMSSAANRAMQEASVDTSSGPNFQRQLGDKIAKIKASYEQTITSCEEKIRLLSAELDNMKVALASKTQENGKGKLGETPNLSSAAKFVEARDGMSTYPLAFV